MSNTIERTLLVPGDIWVSQRKISPISRLVNMAIVLTQTKYIAISTYNKGYTASRATSIDDNITTTEPDCIKTPTQYDEFKVILI